jgi:hypothetical protein
MHWRDTARSPTFFVFDATVLLLIPYLLFIMFFGLPPAPTVIFLIIIGYYVFCALGLRMTLLTSFKFLRWKLAPKRRPSRRPVYIREAYDIQGISSWRITYNQRGVKK